MQRKRLSILLVITVLLSSYLIPIEHVSANSYHIGDYWEYEAEESREGLTINGIVRIDFAGKEKISVGGMEYDTIAFSWSGNGAFSGAPLGMEVSGNLTLTGKQNFQESNEELIKTAEDYFFNGTYSYPGNSGDWLLRYHNETTYRLLIDQKLSKIDVGDLGQSKANVTFSGTSRLKMDDLAVDDSSPNGTFKEEKYYDCIKKETVTVSAGEFETYLIRTTKTDGSYKLDWRSSKVGNSVKVEAYNKDAEKQWSMELKEYYHQQPSSDKLFGLSISELSIIMSLIIVVVIISSFFLAIKRKK